MKKSDYVFYFCVFGSIGFSFGLKIFRLFFYFYFLFGSIDFSIGVVLGWKFSGYFFYFFYFFYVLCSFM